MKRKEKVKKSAASGVIALIFLIIGFQTAIFFEKVINRPAPQTESKETTAADHHYSVTNDSLLLPISYSSPEFSSGTYSRSKTTNRNTSVVESNQRTRYGGYPAPAKSYSKPSRQPRRVESFVFDPNTVTLEELVRLGLSERQAEVILNYRSKGGSFRRKEDFAKMYVVSDTLYQRLEPFIDIPKLELNMADSAALVTLRGIGPYYARRIIEYRERLGGFLDPQQLMEIDGIDQERFDGFAFAVQADSSHVTRFDFWSLTKEELIAHPYVGTFAAKGILRYRSVTDTSQWSFSDLVRNNILTPDCGSKLSRYHK
ncbi:MAG: helix-hairpin-helix domain-containing protein [Bacteroidales bacterium]|nr:helix-hairpin-helix domain-containing protein [Bacteroidales bacterium]